jgi:hypothetical protein
MKVWGSGCIGFFYLPQHQLDVSGQLHAPVALHQRIGGWVGPRACLNNMEIRKFFTLLGLEPQPFPHPVHSQSFY